ncbi:hypothetical protein CF327_g6024 [Tilletia walkeri]|uniref:Uncharacterized protein n=1 Tax=Tilletia walkeri TaxID=117179 RepID=A0A8X7NGL7_9BASI|nr:hypothetical protein CF327_g6024 [Tilletia walkeri]KAE8272015.1 hypothetical protein A4X09_0g327 [Tilletia walkeri]
MTDGERQPLLVSSSSPSALGQSTAKQHVKEGRRFTFPHLPLPLRIAIVKLVADLTLQAAGAVLLDVLRAWNCAALYEEDPHNVRWKQPDACHNPEVEMAFATWFKYLQVGGSLLSAFMIPFYGRLIKFGRKPVLIFVLLAATISPTLPGILLPFSPPVGENASFLSARAVKNIFSICTVLVGLTSTDLLPTLVLRTMLVDISSPSDRTKNFTLMHTALLLGGIIGPGLGAVVSLASPNHRDNSSPELPTFAQGMPLPGRGVFYMTLGFYLFGVIFTIFFIPETKPIERTEPINRPSASAQSSNPESISGVIKGTLTSLKVLLPAKHNTAGVDAPNENNGSNSDTFTPRQKSDWRVTMVATTWALFFFSTVTFGLFAVFAGYRWKLTGGQLSTMVSILNIIRALGLIFALPHIVKLFERTTRRPSELQGLTLDELKEMDRAFKDNTATASGQEREHGSDGDITEQSRFALLRWRTTIDLRLTRVGLGADAVAWLLITVAAASSSPALAGTSLAGAGICLVAAPIVIPAFSAAAVSIVTMVLNSGENLREGRSVLIHSVLTIP